MFGVNNLRRRLIVTALTLSVILTSSNSVSAQEPPTEQSSATQDQSPTPDPPTLFDQPAVNQDDPTRLRQLSNVPDDIGYQLQESDEQIDSIFSRGPLTPLHGTWQRATDRLKAASGLDLGMNYTTIYQRADSTVSGPRDAADGDFDFFGRWHLLGCENDRPGALVFSSESRHRLSNIPPTDLNTGAVGGTIVGFGRQDFSLVQFYWERGSYEDGKIYRIGKMDPALIYDGGRYVSANYAFFSPAFSDTQPMALAGAGLGFAAAVYPTKSTYVVAGIHDANGKRTTSGFNTFFSEGEFFTAVELGWFPNEGKRNEGMYHITFWNTDARQNAGKQSDNGLALTLEQQIGSEGKLVPFLRYALADRGINGIRENLSIGIGIEDVLGQNDDLIGMACSWQEPTNPTLRNQFVFESFYRFYITPHTHLTPDVQVVVDPANAPNKNAVTVFGLRLRTLY
jgi:porin